jgi:hypothetical protein
VLQFLALVADGMRTDEELLKAFVSQVWVNGDRAIAVMNFNGKQTTPYEVECLIKEKHEPAGQEQVRATSLWLPQDGDKTNQKRAENTLIAGTPIVLLESGIGVMISLNAA